MMWVVIAALSVPALCLLSGSSHDLRRMQNIHEAAGTEKCGGVSRRLARRRAVERQHAKIISRHLKEIRWDATKPSHQKSKIRNEQEGHIRKKTAAQRKHRAMKSQQPAMKAELLEKAKLEQKENETDESGERLVNAATTQRIEGHTQRKSKRRKFRQGNRQCFSKDLLKRAIKAMDVACKKASKRLVSSPNRRQPRQQQQQQHRSKPQHKPRSKSQRKRNPQLQQVEQEQEETRETDGYEQPQRRRQQQKQKQQQQQQQRGVPGTTAVRRRRLCSMRDLASCGCDASSAAATIRHVVTGVARSSASRVSIHGWRTSVPSEDLLVTPFQDTDVESKALSRTVLTRDCAESPPVGSNNSADVPRDGTFAASPTKAATVPLTSSTARVGAAAATTTPRSASLGGGSSVAADSTCATPLLRKRRTVVPREDLDDASPEDDWSSSLPSTPVQQPLRAAMASTPRRESRRMAKPKEQSNVAASPRTPRRQR
eukprot:TRINITY_DN1174_c0_g5_i1.p1 TRINITY_DN1174_c0_g5~~TRINITY_DN1174_c0_g5_i1.p1  ORF type:complete len:486 (-),score=84.85 TRINITY_DN1174_c0_g5_i1:233-1690(-)